MDGTDDVGREVGARLRALREATGLSLSATARRAGLGKGTLSELEAGRRNPTLGTLFAVTTALGQPLSAALPVPADAAPDAAGTAVDAWLVERGEEADVYRLRVRAGARRRSAPHGRRVREQVLVVAGHLRCGPEDGPVVLAPGGTTSFAGDVPHVWEAEGGEDVSAVLVMRRPPA